MVGRLVGSAAFPWDGYVRFFFPISAKPAYPWASFCSFSYRDWHVSCVSTIGVTWGQHRSRIWISLMSNINSCVRSNPFIAIIIDIFFRASVQRRIMQVTKSQDQFDFSLVPVVHIRRGWLFRSRSRRLRWMMFLTSSHEITQWCTTRNPTGNEKGVVGFWAIFVVYWNCITLKAY